MAEREPVHKEELRLRLLVLRCQTGDEEAFARLLDTVGPRTLRYLRSLLGGDDADDAQQEVWLSVYRSIAGLADPGAFRTWLYTTTRHRAIDQLRRWCRESELFAEEDYERVEATNAPEEGEHAYDATELDALLAELPSPQREAVLLRYRDEMSYAEIAVITGCPIGTVRTRLPARVHRGLERHVRTAPRAWRARWGDGSADRESDVEQRRAVDDVVRVRVAVHHHRGNRVPPDRDPQHGGGVSQDAHYDAGRDPVAARRARANARDAQGRRLGAGSLKFSPRKRKLRLAWLLSPSTDQS